MMCAIVDDLAKTAHHSKEGIPIPYPIPVTCPACNSRMAVTELTCPTCHTRVQGEFETPGLHRLNAEQLQFVEVFLRCRGNIREVERDLKLSYPTVRSRLDAVIEAMGYALPDAGAQAAAAEAVLEGLDSGRLTFESAMQVLKGERLS